MIVILGVIGWLLSYATVGLGFVSVFLKLLDVTSVTELTGSQRVTLLLCTQV